MPLLFFLLLDCFYPWLSQHRGSNPVGFGGTQPSRMSLCFIFHWGIWDLVDCSRQDGEASETLRGGGGRSVFIVLSREVGVTQLPWKFLFLAQRQLEPVRLPGNKSRT